MKKYTFCFLLFFAASIICLAAGFFITRYYVRQEQAIPNVTVETETVEEPRVVVNQEQVEPAAGRTLETQYYLVAEDGFLLVFCEDKKTVCLYTHMPITEFPDQEQEKLRQGIWFSNMLEIFNYLESYTS